MSQAIVLAIVAHIFWATGNLLNVKLSRKITPLQTIVWQTVFLVFLLFPVVIFRPVHFSASAIGLTVALAITLYSGSLMFYTALSKGSVQISGAITATVPAFIALLSIAFLGISPTSVSLILIA